MCPVDQDEIDFIFVDIAFKSKIFFDWIMVAYMYQSIMNTFHLSYLKAICYFFRLIFECYSFARPCLLLAFLYLYCVSKSPKIGYFRVAQASVSKRG